MLLSHAEAAGSDLAFATGQILFISGGHISHGTVRVNIILLFLLRIGKFRRILALEDADQEGFEDEGLYYHQRKRGDPKSRAQQQLRELEGKERLEKSRVERRLKLTQVAGRGEP